MRERLLSCYTKLLEAANVLGYFPVQQPHSLLVTGEIMNTVLVSIPWCDNYMTLYVLYSSTESDIDLDSMCNLDSPTYDMESLETSVCSNKKCIDCM